MVLLLFKYYLIFVCNTDFRTLLVFHSVDITILYNHLKGQRIKKSLSCNTHSSIISKYFSPHTISHHITLFLDFLGNRSSMNNMDEIVKFTENHQKQEVTVVEPTDEMSEKLFKFLHKSDVSIISVVVVMLL